MTTPPASSTPPPASAGPPFVPGQQTPPPPYSPAPQQSAALFSAGPQHPGSPHPGTAAGAAPGRRGNPFGLVSLLAAAAIFLSMIVQLIAQVNAVAGDDYQLLGVLGLVTSVINGIFAIVAITFGIIGLARRGRSHVLAGIGLGVGITTLISTLLWGLVYPLALNLA